MILILDLFRNICYNYCKIMNEVKNMEMTSGENIILVGKPTWCAILDRLIITSIIEIYWLSRFVDDKIDSSGMLLIIIFAIIILIPLISRIINILTCRIELTNKRVMGTIKWTNISLELSNVDNISVSYRIFGRIFHYCNIKVKSISGLVEFVNIKNGDKFVALIIEQKEKLEEEKMTKQSQMNAKFQG